MLAIVAIATALLAGQEPVTIEQELARIAANTILPERIDDITTLLGARASGRTLTYVYLVEQKEGTADQMREFFMTQKIPALCQDESTQRHHRLGATIQYQWVSRGDRETVTIDVDQATCRSLR